MPVIRANKCDMERNILAQLIDWQNKTNRKPLILNGARQVGKTYILKEFGRTQYKNIAYVNCDNNDVVTKIFSRDYDIRRIILSLSAVTLVSIKPGETLIILDEIQENPLALNSLKYFCENAPEYHVAVAGSLLGISLHGIPSQLAKDNKKFIYGAIKKGARASEFELAIQWLIDAGLVYRVNRVTTPSLPLKFYEDFSAFKLFTLDVGLMGAMVDTPPETILVGESCFSEYKGAFTELFALTQMVSKGIPAYYYSANDSRVEIDFLIQKDEKVIPIEVKAEVNVRSKSLRTYIDKHPQLKGMRLSMLPYKDQGWMENKPLYAVNFCL